MLSDFHYLQPQHTAFKAPSKLWWQGQEQSPSSALNGRGMGLMRWWSSQLQCCCPYWSLSKFFIG